MSALPIAILSVIFSPRKIAEKIAPYTDSIDKRIAESEVLTFFCPRSWKKNPTNTSNTPQYKSPGTHLGLITAGIGSAMNAAARQTTAAVII